VIGGRYRLRAPIGAGAMGEVWRADHVSLGTPVAVKLVDTANRKDAQELLARFQLEARSAAQLKSPHVVQILDHGADGRVAFIAMEFLEGESLERRLERRGRLTPSEVAHLLREMALGLDRAHAAGIVHRDLKPPNVFIARADAAEVVKVLDFGIAKVLGAPREAHLETQAGFVVGTPAYMSPEQVLGRPIDHRSDLWQMAIIAFECMTGKRPFDGETLGQLFIAVCSLPIPAPSSIGPVPPGFDAWFARGADRNPAMRFGSAGEMAEALRFILAPGGTGEAAIPTFAGPRREVVAGATGRNEVWSTARVEPDRRRVAIVAGFTLALLSVVILGGVGWLSLRRRPATMGPSLDGAPDPTAIAPAARPPSPPVTVAAAPTQVAAAQTASTTNAAAVTSAGAAAGEKPGSGKRHPTNPSPPRPAGKSPVDLGI
jgi:eukaryotic-like serine/threonine-protein kinase